MTRMLDLTTVGALKTALKQFNDSLPLEIAVVAGHGDGRALWAEVKAVEAKLILRLHSYP